MSHRDGAGPRLVKLACPRCGTALRPAAPTEILLFCSRCPTAIEIETDRLVDYPVAAVVGPATAYVPGWSLLVEAKIERFEASSAAETPLGKVRRAGDVLTTTLVVPARAATDAAVAHARRSVGQPVQSQPPGPGVPVYPGTLSHRDAMAIARFVVVSAIAEATGTVAKLKVVVTPKQTGVLLSG